jgi:hypothetical protein
LYIGKRSAGLWTMAVLLIAASAAFSVGDDPVMAIALGYALPIYIFAFIDARFTAREANEGRDYPPNGNPRTGRARLCQVPQNVPTRAASPRPCYMMFEQKADGLFRQL